MGGMAMSEAFRKYFTDRYAMLHEQQILDYLNQRKAPVPQVIKSQLDESFLEMSHGGMNLSQWIKTARPDHLLACCALAQAIESVLVVARMGVWHVDLAYRNFVIQPAGPGAKPTVLLIDFANAISHRFPLLKPLWMLPTELQHPSLRASLTADWQSFYDRHGLDRPERWDTAFEVPFNLYKEDWTTGLNVENLQHPLSVIAHGIGQMILQDQSGWQEILKPQSIDWTELLDLQSDDLAVLRLESCIAQLVMPNADDSTPRPRMKSSDATPVVTSVIRPVVPSVALDVEPPVIRKMEPAVAATEVAPEEAAVDPKVHPFAAQTLTNNKGQRNFGPVLCVLLSGAFVAAGWTLLDAMYTVLRLKLTWLGWSGLALALAGTANGAWKLIWREHKKISWAQTIWTHDISMALLLTEAWALRAHPVLLSLIAASALISAALAWPLSSKRDGA
jgi:hypothetical protein